MATATYISAQDQYTASNGPLAFKNLQSAKFESYQEQMTSPHSTQYTEGDFSDVPTEIKRTNSTPFYEEISSFETNETGLNSSVKSSEMQIEEQLGSPQSTQAPSRKESDDTYSVNEEAEGENQEEDDEDSENPELRDWNEKKEKMLKNLAAKCKYDWKKIAKKFNVSENTQLTPLVLKQKYKDLTKVSIPLRVKFTHEEDLQIAKYFELYGCNWAQIATHFTERTAMMLKNRYYSHIRKKNLLASMLEEVKDVSTEPSTEESVQEEAVVEEKKAEIEQVPVINKPNEAEKDNFELAYEIQLRFKFRNFPKIYFNPLYYEIENAFPNELNERITPSSYY